jgi:hypothetical protein
MENLASRMIELQSEARILEQKLENTHNELKEIQKQLRAEVVTSQLGSTIILSHKDRVLKCSRNSRNRWNIKENGKTIASDSWLSINIVKLNLASGII